MPEIGGFGIEHVEADTGQGARIERIDHGVQ